MAINDVTGLRFGRLVAIEKSFMKNNRSMWKCKCDCGNIVFVNIAGLNNGSSKSCGCLRKERNRKQGLSNRVHGMCGTRIYNVWHSMRKRCNDKNNHNYPRYGAIGISICKEWNDFECFYKWSIDNNYSDCLSIDRIDNTKGYSPDNCRWATPKQQAINRKSTIEYELFGITKPLVEWAELAGKNRRLIYERYHDGRTIFDNDDLLILSGVV